MTTCLRKRPSRSSSRSPRATASARPAGYVGVNRETVARHGRKAGAHAARAVSFSVCLGNGDRHRASTPGASPRFRGKSRMKQPWAEGGTGGLSAGSLQVNGPSGRYPRESHFLPQRPSAGWKDPSDSRPHGASGPRIPAPRRPGSRPNRPPAAPAEPHSHDPPTTPSWCSRSRPSRTRSSPKRSGRRSSAGASGPATRACSWMKRRCRSTRS